MVVVCQIKSLAGKITMAGAPLYRRAYPLPPGTVTLISLLYTLTPILITPFKGPMYDTKYYVDNNPPPPHPPDDCNLI